MMSARARANLRCMPVLTRPCREELEALVRHYHHLESEHERAHPEGTVRHHLGLLMGEDRDRFERLLTEFVPDESVRAAWHSFLQHRGAEPPGPPAISVLVFKGRSDAGSVAEIRRERSGELAVEVDGQLVERLPAEHASLDEQRRAVFRLDGVEFIELFDARSAALQALEAFRDSGGRPPWEHASGLLADGLIDVTFGLTPRGRRALAVRTKSAR
jgi:hypothetical protein